MQDGACKQTSEGGLQPKISGEIPRAGKNLLSNLTIILNIR